VGKTSLIREIRRETREIIDPYYFSMGELIPSIPPNPLLTFDRSGSHGRLKTLLSSIQCTGDPDKTIYLDYPDARIGWGTQKYIFPLLRHYFPQRQFIVETQSPILISRLMAEQVIFLYPNHANPSEDKPYYAVTHGPENRYRTSSFGQIADLFGSTSRMLPPPLANALDTYRFYARLTHRTPEEEQKLEEAIKVITVDYEETLPFPKP